MLILEQKSCILGPTIFKIPQPIIIHTFIWELLKIWSSMDQGSHSTILAGRTVIVAATLHCFYHRRVLFCKIQVRPRSLLVLPFVATLWMMCNHNAIRQFSSYMSDNSEFRTAQGSLDGAK